MYKLIYILIALSLLAGSALGNSYTWFTPPGRGQLEQDPTLIPQGKGFLFVPTMTGSLNEPSFLVLQGDKPIREAAPGTGVLLSPGSYKLLVGSGTDLQMTVRTVPVQEGMTTLVKPFWAGLVINVMSENRTSINESYELYRESSQENYGLGFGVEEERGEAVKTWLLPPGVYSVVRLGDNISTTRKFSVRLEPGELVQRNLVVDTKDGTFIGFYPPAQYGLLTQVVDSRWKTSLQLSGSPRLSTSQNTTGADRSVLLISAEIIGSSVYNTDRHYANLWLDFEEGFTREEGGDFRKSIDKFEVRATYIYRLSKRLGPYLRGVFNTKLFATEDHFDQPHNLLIRDGDQIESMMGIGEFTLSPPFSPLDLRQGIGINAQVISSFSLNLDMRVGFGARQHYVTDTYDLNSSRTVARKLQDTATTGLEAVLLLRSRFSRLPSLDSEFDILIPETTTDTWEFNWENRLRLPLSRFVSLVVVFDFKREQAIRRLQSEQQVLLRLNYLL
ncbi:MAG: DUF3078 domain-containing protein [Gemmatimonadetes bacterium]|nr:DUF3078 domain-containing protein [Gemmatimonadota bacterium]MYB67452.1 DUF3078 domain-containing protein [Gemmatimonadota bacterium]